jgi:hypothetical protein
MQKPPWLRIVLLMERLKPALLWQNPLLQPALLRHYLRNNITIFRQKFDFS